jgi:hypothetical protein
MPDSTLPQQTALGSSELLATNLAALQKTQPVLHERVHWPVAGEHLFQDEAGAWTYRFRDGEFPLALGAEVVEEALAGLDAEFEGEVFVFGLGLGEVLSGALRRAPRARFVAWDRDPWVLRQVLCSNDWSEALYSGRLRLGLGVDLVAHLEVRAASPVLWHPLLTGVYHNERILLDEGLCDRRAFVGAGGLFVDSLADSLRAEGFSVYTFDAERLSTEELTFAVEIFRPELLACINHLNGLAEFCAELALDYHCWEIDPATDEPRALTRPATNAKLFTYRSANVEVYRRAGFAHVEHLPLAADPARRQPVDLTPDERTRYGAPISFVGTSMMHNVSGYQEAFLDQAEAWEPGSRDLARGVLLKVVRNQREDLSRYRVPELLERRLPGLREHYLSRGQPDPALLIAEVCAAEKRLNYIAELAEYGVDAWGDDGWRQLEEHGVRYRGPALHDHDLPRIYSASTINLDVGRLYQSDIVTMRVFDVLACGGFVLTEHSEALAELFEVGVELESYRTLEELREKVEWFLKRPAEVQSVARRGRAAVLERHRISQRVATMLARRA